MCLNIPTLTQLSICFHGTFTKIIRISCILTTHGTSEIWKLRKNTISLTIPIVFPLKSPPFERDDWLVGKNNGFPRGKRNIPGRWEGACGKGHWTRSKKRGLGCKEIDLSFDDRYIDDAFVEDTTMRESACWRVNQMVLKASHTHIPELRIAPAACDISWNATKLRLEVSGRCSMWSSLIWWQTLAKYYKKTHTHIWKKASCESNFDNTPKNGLIKGSRWLIVP